MNPFARTTGVPSPAYGGSPGFSGAYMGTQPMMNPWAVLPYSPGGNFGILPWRGQVWPGMGPALPPVNYQIPSGQPGSGVGLPTPVPATGSAQAQAGPMPATGAAQAGLMPAGPQPYLGGQMVGPPAGPMPPATLPAGTSTGGQPPPTPQDVYLPRGLSTEIPGFNPLVPGGNFTPQWHDVTPPPAPPPAPEPQSPDLVLTTRGTIRPRDYLETETQRIMGELGMDRQAAAQNAYRLFGVPGIPDPYSNYYNY